MRNLYPKLNTFAIFLCVLIFLAASTKTDIKYTQYQVLVFAIRGYENFSPYWYEDGKTATGKQKYSIGYGYNDWGLYSRRRGIVPPISHEQALALTLDHLETLPTQSSDKWVNLAFKLRAYNTGLVKKVSDLRGCCGASVGCGSPMKDIRDSHKPRREFEWALANHNWGRVNVELEKLREKNLKILQKGGR